MDTKEVKMDGRLQKLNAGFKTKSLSGKNNKNNIQY